MKKYVNAFIMLGLICAMTFSAMGADKPDGTYKYDLLVGNVDAMYKMILSAALQDAEVVMEDGKMSLITVQGETNSVDLELVEEGIDCPTDEQELADHYTGVSNGTKTDYYFTDSDLYMSLDDGSNSISGFARFTKELSEKNEPGDKAEEEQNTEKAIDNSAEISAVGTWKDPDSESTLVIHEDGTFKMELSISANSSSSENTSNSSTSSTGVVSVTSSSSGGGSGSVSFSMTFSGNWKQEGNMFKITSSNNIGTIGEYELQNENGSVFLSIEGVSYEKISDVGIYETEEDTEESPEAEDLANNDKEKKEQGGDTSETSVIGDWENRESGVSMTFKKDGTVDVKTVSEISNNDSNGKISFSGTTTATISLQWEQSDDTVKTSYSGIEQKNYIFKSINGIEILTNGTEVFYREGENGIVNEEDIKEAIGNASNNETEQVIYADPETVQKVQEALNAAGYDCGAPDGKAGDKTHAALNAYQEANGLIVQNDITDEVLSALGI